MRTLIVIAMLSWLLPPERLSMTYALLVDHHLLHHLLGEAHEADHEHDEEDLPWHHHHSAQCESISTNVIIGEPVHVPDPIVIGPEAVEVPKCAWWPNDPAQSVWRPPRA